MVTYEANPYTSGNGLVVRCCCHKMMIQKELCSSLKIILALKKKGGAHSENIMNRKNIQQKKISAFDLNSREITATDRVIIKRTAKTSILRNPIL